MEIQKPGYLLRLTSKIARLSFYKPVNYFFLSAFFDFFTFLAGFSESFSTTAAWDAASLAMGTR
jgi:hypothetical protein